MVKLLLRLVATAAFILGASAAHASPVYDQVFPSPSTIRCNSDASCAILDHIRVQALTYSGSPGTGSYTWTASCASAPDAVFYIRPTGATLGCFQMDGFSTTSVVVTNALTSAHILVGNASNVATDVAMSGDATIANTGALTLANSGVTAGTYVSGAVTVDAKGRVTAVANYLFRTISAGSTDTATTADQTIAWNSATASAKTQTLYACGSAQQGYKLNIKDEEGNAGTYAVTITPNGANTIDGAANYFLTFNYKPVTLQCNGAGNWVVLTP